MENITKYPKYGESQKEIPVRCNNGLTFTGTAVVSLNKRTPTAIFFHKGRQIFKRNFGDLLDQIYSIEDLVVLDIFKQQNSDDLAIRLMGSGGYRSTRSIPADSLKPIIAYPA